MRRSISIHWYIIASIFLLFLDYFSVLTVVKTPLEVQVIAIKKTLYTSTLGAKNFIEVVFKYPQIAKISSDFDKLKLENQELLLKSNELEEENIQLRHQLEAPLPAKYKYIPSGVVSVSNFMELSVGERQGVKPGMVVVYGDSLVGQVFQTSAVRSKVRLLSDPSSKIDAKTQRGASGQVVGYLNESLIMEDILQKEALFLDDLVMTSGGGNLPPNLLIGSIGHITVSDVSAYKQANVVPSIDVYSLNTVFVINY